MNTFFESKYHKTKFWHEDYDQYLYSKMDLPFYIRSEKRLDTQPFCHTHFGFEMGVVASGQSVMQFEKQTLEMQEGDFYFVDCMIPHGHFCAKNSLIVWAHTKIEPVLNISPIRGDTRIIWPFIALRFGMSPVISGHDELFEQLVKAQKTYGTGRDNCDLAAWMILSNVFTTLAALKIETNQTEKTRVPTHHIKTIQNAVHYIHMNYGMTFTLGELAAHCHLSVSRFSELFSRVMRYSPIEYRNFIRINHAVEQIVQTDEKIITIAYNCGFSSLSHFNEIFKRITGVNPNVFRKGFHPFRNLAP